MDRTNRMSSKKTGALPAGLRQHAAEVEVLPPVLQRRLLLEVQRGHAAAAALDECSDPAGRRDLQAQVRLGRRAMQRMISSNMRLVTWVVSRFHPKAHNLDRDDLVQEGVGGLTRAIEKFDLTRDTAFSTYATWWIRQSVSRAMMNGGLVRIPVHVQDGTAASEAARAWARRFDEIMSIEGLYDDLDDLEAELSAAGEIDDWPDHDLDVGPATDAVDDEVEADLVRQLVRDALAQLDEREAMILRCRCGLDGDPETLEEIGQRLGVTRERVRQIEKTALAKCRRRLDHVA